MKVEFWSSTEYSGFLAGLIRELRGRGVDARQCFHISEVSYRSAQSTPARWLLRFRQYLFYPLQLGGTLVGRRIRSVWHRMRGKACPDGLCVVSTNTFYAPWIATFLHPNVVFLVYDLFPEAMIHSGKWREGTLQVRLVRWITRQTLCRAQTSVFLGQRLRDYVESIHGAVPQAVIIPVGADRALFEQSPGERVERPEQDAGTESLDARESASSTTILYCGNLGHMHDTATLFDYWKRVPEEAPLPLDWRFHCSGPKRSALEAAVGSLPRAAKARVRIGAGLPQLEWIEAMESAQLALVTMTPGAEQVVMPSKTYSALMAGQAVLAIAPEQSDLVDLIKAADCGWWVEPGDVEGLSKVLQSISAEPETVFSKRENAYQYAQAHFGQDVLAQAWASLQPKKGVAS